MPGRKQGEMTSHRLAVGIKMRCGGASSLISHETSPSIQYSGSYRHEFGGRVDGFDVRFEINHDVESEYDRELEFDQDLQFECFAHSSTMTNQRVTAHRGRGPLFCA